MKKRRKLKLASCYKFEKGDHGWCATCVPNAAKGTPGYCGEGATNTHLEAPTVQPNSTNWGFCTRECTNSGLDWSNTLMETKLSIVPSHTCHKLVKDALGSASREICAGHQIYRRIDAYRLLSRKNRKFKRVPLRERHRDKEVRYGKLDSLSTQLRLINLKRATILRVVLTKKSLA